MLGQFATASRLTPIHQVSPAYCRAPPAHGCPRNRRQRRRQRQRVTEGTAMAPWNVPNEHVPVQLVFLSCCSTSLRLLKSRTRMTVLSRGSLAMSLSSNRLTPLPTPSATIFVSVPTSMFLFSLPASHCARMYMYMYGLLISKKSYRARQ